MRDCSTETKNGEIIHLELRNGAGGTRLLVVGERSPGIHNRRHKTEEDGSSGPSTSVEGRGA